MAVVGVTVSWVVGYFTAESLSDQVRYAGTVLQVLGLAVVALGISQLREMFGRPTMLGRAASWIKGLPALLRKPEPIVLTVDPVIVKTSVGTPTIHLGRNPKATTDQRLDWLEKNLDRIENELRTNDRDRRQAISETRADLRAETKHREAEIRKLNRTVEEVSVGGLHLESIGVTWLVLGVLGTSIPAEIAAFLAFILGV